MRIVLAALSLVLSLMAAPSGVALGQTAPLASDGLAFLKKPIFFYLAKGEPDSCGSGCSEWIAAEGAFDPGAVARFRAFLAKTRAAKLPIYIHSPGGLGERAFDIGRLIRQRGMTVGVSRTLPEECKALDEKSCNALKRSGKMLSAELDPLSVCNSACVYMLAGGKVRQVPPGARVGVHLGRPIRLYSDGRITTNAKLTQAQISASDGRQRKYFRDMGIDPKLVDIASKIPYESVRYLSRDEIASLGIDKREFQETRWVVATGKIVSVRKLFVETKGPDHKELRLGILDVSRVAGDRSRLVYLVNIRGLASDEDGAKQKLRLEFANRRVALPGPIPQKQSGDFDTGRSFDYWASIQSLDLLDEVAAQSNFDIVSVSSTETTDSGGRTTRLSTAGLPQAIGALRQKCGGEAVYSGATVPKPESKPENKP